MGRTSRELLTFFSALSIELFSATHYFFPDQELLNLEAKQIKMKLSLASSLVALLAGQSFATVQETPVCVSGDGDLEVCTYSSFIRTRKASDANIQQQGDSRELVSVAHRPLRASYVFDYNVG